MTDKRTQQDADNSNMSKDPDEWVMGKEPMTGQRSYLKTLSEEAHDRSTRISQSRSIETDRRIAAQNRMGCWRQRIPLKIKEAIDGSPPSFMRADAPLLASLGRNRGTGHDTRSAHLVGTANRIDRRDRTVDHGHFRKCLCDLAKSLSSCREFCRCTRALRAGRLGVSRGGVGLSIAPGPAGHVAILHVVDDCLEDYHQHMSARSEIREKPLANS